MGILAWGVVVLLIWPVLLLAMWGVLWCWVVFFEWVGRVGDFLRRW